MSFTFPPPPFFYSVDYVCDSICGPKQPWRGWTPSTFLEEDSRSSRFVSSCESILIALGGILRADLLTLFSHALTKEILEGIPQCLAILPHTLGGAKVFGKDSLCHLLPTFSQKGESLDNGLILLYNRQDKMLVQATCSNPIWLGLIWAVMRACNFPLLLQTGLWWWYNGAQSGAQWRRHHYFFKEREREETN